MRQIITLFLALTVFCNAFANDSQSERRVEIVKKAIPAVVFIKTEIKTGYTSDNFENPFDHFADEFFRRFFGGTRPGAQNPTPQQGGGSGFLISKDGFILTNNHVIKDATKILAILNDGREYEAEVIGTDPRTDLAIVKIEEVELPFLTFGDSDDLEVAESVIAIGNPFALQASVSSGIVSAKGRQDLGITTLEDFIQTDAAINPGNSGGPLINLYGEVIGINTAIASRSGGYMGIGFAIPSRLAKHVVDQLLETGSVQRAYLGVVLQEIDKELSEAMNLSRQEGILVAEVVKDSPAEKSGLQTGDIIMDINGKKANNVNKFRNEIALMDPDTEVKLKVQRQEEEIYLDVILGILSESEVASQELFQKLGIDIDELHNLNPDTVSKLGYNATVEGIVITNVKNGSPAHLAGIRPYQLITGVVIDWKNQKKVANVDEFNDALKQVGNKKYVVLIIRQQNYQRYYTLKLQ